MMKKERNLRLILSGILLLAVVAAGIGMYRIDNNTRNPETEDTQLAEESSLSEVEDNGQDQTFGEETGDEVASADGFYEEDVLAEDETDTQTTDVAADAETPAVDPEAEVPAEETPAVDTETASTGVQQVLPALEYAEGAETLWPIAAGDVLIDYSMDASVYFPTLDVYKYSPALVLSSPIDQEVRAMANSKVVSVEESTETGLTVAMDMGNGYQAVYGQLKDVNLAVDQTIEAGTVIGTIAEPTKYFSKEGSNLYLSMTKDGEPIDPVMYLPTEEE